MSDTQAFSGPRRAYFAVLFGLLIAVWPASGAAITRNHGPGSKGFGHEFQWAPRHYSKPQVGLHFGLSQPLLLNGLNLAVDLHWAKWVLEYSHGMNLDYNRIESLALTTGERDAGLVLESPWTTGFGLGLRVLDELYPMLEVKAHHYRAAVQGQSERYTTVSIGPAIAYRLFLFRGLFVNTYLRYWPNVWTSRGNSDVRFNSGLRHSTLNLGFSPTFQSATPSTCSKHSVVPPPKSTQTAKARQPRSTNSDRSKREKDSHATRQRLIQATLHVLGSDGFAALGINRVAREAGVDKVLIYRYFENLTGLVQATARSADFWCTFEEIVGDTEQLRNSTPGAAVATVLKRYARALHRRPVALEILAWETVARTEHTAAFESVREALSVRLGTLLFELFEKPKVDVPAITTLLAGAINYLSVRRRSIRVFNEVEIGSEEGWQRLECAIDLICESVLN